MKSAYNLPFSIFFNTNSFCSNGHIWVQRSVYI